MPGSYAQTYAQFCLIVIEQVEARLGRELTAAERRSIWNTGSLMMLEVVERGMVATDFPADVERVLRSMETWTGDCFQRAGRSCVEQVAMVLGRPLTKVEVAAICGAEHVGALLILAEHLNAAQPTDRETVFREWVVAAG